MWMEMLIGNGYVVSHGSRGSRTHFRIPFIRFSVVALNPDRLGRKVLCALLRFHLCEGGSYNRIVGSVS